jgi:hypothetical protein
MPTSESQSSAVGITGELDSRTRPWMSFVDKLPEFTAQPKLTQPNVEGSSDKLESVRLSKRAGTEGKSLGG